LCGHLGGDSIAFEDVSHPPYNLNLASLNSVFFFFAMLKKHFKGICFASDEEVQADMQKWF
jgi:hypothetical protein